MDTSHIDYSIHQSRKDAIRIAVCDAVERHTESGLVRTLWILSTKLAKAQFAGSPSREEFVEVRNIIFTNLLSDQDYELRCRIEFIQTIEE